MLEVLPLSKTCTRCGETKPISGFYKGCGGSDGYFNQCKECKKAYERERRLADPERDRADAKKYYNKLMDNPVRRAKRREDSKLNGRKYRAESPEKHRAAGRKYYAKNAVEISRKSTMYSIARYKALRQEVIDHYGGKCTCCGEHNYVFLAIDHKNNNGAEERRNNKQAKASDSSFLRWIKQRNYPDDYQILCHNCNWAKFRGGCPHLDVGLNALALAGGCV